MTLQRLFKASIAGRLIVFSTLLASATIVVAAIVLWFIVTSIVREQVDQRLDVQVDGIRNALVADASGSVTLRGSLDGPPFDRPASGWYWQVKGQHFDLFSRSLAGTKLEVKPPHFAWTSLLLGRTQPAEGADNSGTRLHFRVANAVVGNQSVTIVAAAPSSAIILPALKALAWLVATMVALGAALIAGNFLQVKFGLKPLRSLSSDVAAISAGEKARLPPVEVQELISIGQEINRLIELNDERLHQSRIHFANLAHSLKTPVASLQLALDDGNDTNRELRDLVNRIELRLRHHLARARSTAATPGRAQTVSVNQLINDILIMMRLLYADRAMFVDLKMASEISVACSEDDFDEILGNIIDNAFKWARSSVLITVTSNKGHAVITVADDGPGLANNQIVRAMEPGVRFDETVPGHGFGLSIAKELSELYGGSIALNSTECSGLVVVVDLPLGMA